MITDDELKQMREVCEKATPGPWSWDDDAIEMTAPSADRPIIETDCGFYGPTENDRQFIAMARNNFERLLDDLERLRAQRDEARLQLEWESDDYNKLEKDRDAWKARAEKLAEALEWIWGGRPKEVFYPADCRCPIGYIRGVCNACTVADQSNRAGRALEEYRASLENRK